MLGEYPIWSLPVKTLCLVGTIISTISSQSLVVLRDKPAYEFNAEEQDADDYNPAIYGYMGGILDGQVIREIQSRRVYIGKTWLASGHCFSFTTPEPIANDSEGWSDDGEKVLITQEVKDYYTAGSGLLKTMMSASSELSPGLGFELNNIEKGSIFEKLGIEDGDIIVSINSIKLLSPLEAIQALRSLKDQDPWDVEILRDGLFITKRVSISGK